jgi:hypothetical protein
MQRFKRRDCDERDDAKMGGSLESAVAGGSGRTCGIGDLMELWLRYRLNHGHGCGSAWVQEACHASANDLTEGITGAWGRAGRLPRGFRRFLPRHREVRRIGLEVTVAASRADDSASC